ncbi:hypothetical protein STAFG_3475 [Streptomyces afghaniensis 772]|uniref:Uncharacterized protein n=1 Tax=Streptomyces afghaniensis 772 TaxID=1283301 RepID=S4NM87_9ACTN|nr:hypothetical protein STAFG_3475 [Streptomyces afghaniensis 772]
MNGHQSQLVSQDSFLSKSAPCVRRRNQRLL